MINITFTLGDPWGDGHGKYDTYHIESNFSVEEITKLYKKFTKENGFDFLKEVGYEYQCSNCIPIEITERLLQLQIINSESIIQYDPDHNYGYKWYEEYFKNNDGCYQLENGTDDLIDIFFEIIKYMDGDFIWGYRDLKEQNLDILDGAGYGLYGD